MNLSTPHPFSDAQASLLASLDLTRDQAIWLSGYLSGTLGSLASSHQTKVVAAAPGVIPAAVKLSAPTEVTILYATESGNSEALAQRTKVLAAQRGLAPKVVNMADAKVSDLANWPRLLVITSTWGEGDPPDSATPFVRALLSDAAPKLSASRFAVLGLGDTSYEKFCQTGKDIDARLAALGAQRLAERVDCDVDYEASYVAWAERVIREIAADAERAHAAEAAATSVSVAVAPPVVAVKVDYGKKNPFPAPLKQRVLLNGRGSSKQTFHLEIGLEGSGFHYEPGDALAVVPTNRPEDVDALLRAAGLPGEAPLTVPEGGTVALREGLLHHFDITNATAAVLRKLQEIAPQPQLAALLAPEGKEALKSFLWGRQVVDVIEAFPAQAPWTPETLTGLFRKLPPRLYSIASSLKAHLGEVHLTVAAVRYHSHGRDRVGVASTFMSDRVEVGSTLLTYLHQNKNFRLPADPSTPVIMVGPGTGVAPFRAFVEERKATGATGKNWLFFGDQHFLTDFLYQTEWQEFLAEGTLSRLDLAFSRDQRQKIYVQHRMLEASKDLYRWLEEGAYFYVCGDASRMAGDVHEALLSIVAKESGSSREGAESYLAEMKKAKRYQRDVY